MSLSVPSVGQGSVAPNVKSPDAALSGGAAKTSTKYGSAPAASLSISAQAKAAKALALAIKTGHDPDGIQDGK